MKTALTAMVAVGAIVLAWRASPTITAFAGMAWVLVGRAFTTTVIFPHPLLLRSADFLDFLLVPLALLAAIVHSLRGPNPGSRGTALWRAWRSPFFAAGGLFMIAVVSTVLNGVGLVWALADWLLLVEPFLLIAAVVISEPSGRVRQMLLRGMSLLLATEMMAMAAQAIRARFFGPVPGYAVWQDYVTGTMFGSRVGAHLLPAAVLLLALVAAAYSRSSVSRWGLPLLAVVFLIVADDKQMLLVSPVVVGVFAITRSAASPRGISRQALAITSVAAGAVLGLAAVYILTFGNGYGASLVSKTLEGGGKAKVVRALLSDTFDSPERATFGAGAGATVSRLASLTLPEEHRTGSPTSFLGLHAQPGAVRYNAIALQYANGGVSDLLSPTSSAFGILGDLGLSGLLVYGALWLLTLRRLVGNSAPLRAPAVAGWVALVPLGVVFDWFEQPAYTLTLATITGLTIAQGAAAATPSVGPASPQRDEDRLPKDHQVERQ